MYTLLSNTPNTSSATVNLPTNLRAKKARVMVEAINNIFFALSDYFSIDYNHIVTCKNYAYTVYAVPIPDDDSGIYDAV